MTNPKTSADLLRMTTAADEIAARIFDYDIYIDPWDRLNFFLRFAVFPFDVQEFLRKEILERSHLLLSKAQELIERYEHLSLERQDYLSYLRETQLYISQLEDEPLVERLAWNEQRVSDETLAIPSMLYDETLPYYKWLGGELSGVGEVVELGCWLGSSTCSMAEGLAANPSAAGRKIYSFDSFEWQDWMEQFVNGDSETRRLPGPGESFVDLFQIYCAAYTHLIEPKPCYVYDGDERGELPPPEWDGKPIELFVYDMGPAHSRITTAWGIFSPSFIPGTTLVVFNEHGNARAEQMRRFTRERAQQLMPVHKPATSTKTFLFKGQ